MKTTGALLAASVAGLFASATPLIASADKTADEVKCEGVNSCKGQGGCAQAKHSCAGQNACKGQGWVKTTSADCKAKKGTPAKS